MIDFSNWTAATAALSPVQQRVFLDVLNLVKDGTSHLAYSADYRDGKPCLVNHVGHMLSVGGGNGIPSQAFGDMVRSFDFINTNLAAVGINDCDGFVSPLAAEFLIRNFGEVKPLNLSDDEWEAARAELAAPAGNPTGAYVEPSDTEFAQYLANMSSEATVEPTVSDCTAPFDIDADATVDADVHNR